MSGAHARTHRADARAADEHAEYIAVRILRTIIAAQRDNEATGDRVKNRPRLGGR